MTTPDDPQWSDEEIEARRNDLAVYPPVIAGIDPDVSQDPNLHGTIDALIASALPAMGTKARMIYAAQKLLGTTEHPPGSNHNTVTVFYNTHVAKIGDGPWCDMSVTEEAWNSGNETPVLGGKGKGFAYVPSHMAWGKAKYGIHTGSVPPAGAIVGFRWDRRKGSTVCDHVGVCEKNLGDGTFHDLEGNIGDAFRREHRDLTYVSCWFMPAYVTVPTPAPATSTDSSWFMGVS